MESNHRWTLSYQVCTVDYTGDKPVIHTLLEYQIDRPFAKYVLFIANLKQQILKASPKILTDAELEEMWPERYPSKHTCLFNTRSWTLRAVSWRCIRVCLENLLCVRIFTFEFRRHKLPWWRSEFVSWIRYPGPSEWTLGLLSQCRGSLTRVLSSMGHRANFVGNDRSGIKSRRPVSACVATLTSDLSCRSETHRAHCPSANGRTILGKFIKKRSFSCSEWISS